MSFARNKCSVGTIHFKLIDLLVQRESFNLCSDSKSAEKAHQFYEQSNMSNPNMKKNVFCIK